MRLCRRSTAKERRRSRKSGESLPAKQSFAAHRAAKPQLTPVLTRPLKDGAMCRFAEDFSDSLLPSLRTFKRPGLVDIATTSSAQIISASVATTIWRRLLACRIACAFRRIVAYNTYPSPQHRRRPHVFEYQKRLIKKVVVRADGRICRGPFAAATFGNHLSRSRQSKEST